MEIALWRVDGDPVRLTPAGHPREKGLEDLIEADPTILGIPLLMIGRQVQTTGGPLDLLAVDGEGALHLLELKRDKTPREVVAQVLDYGSWVRELGHQDVLDLFKAYCPDVPFEQAFEDRLGVAPPEELNASHRLTIVASDTDAATERILGYLAGFDIPINVALFRYFTDDGRSYLARTWLLPESAPTDTGSRRKGTKEPWNGHDWYVSFGDDSGSRSWEDARRYGFVSAGGGTWFSRTLRLLPVGARIFVYIPKVGYIAVATVTGEPQAFDDAVVTVDGVERKLADLELHGRYHHGDGPDQQEFVVTVDWIAVRDKAGALRAKGMFANQNSACKLRNRFTLDKLIEYFGLEG
ncbi:endonuclease NucS domain-containing protein [Longispora urticae]